MPNPLAFLACVAQSNAKRELVGTGYQEIHLFYMGTPFLGLAWLPVTGSLGEQPINPSAFPPVHHGSHHGIHGRQAGKGGAPG